MFKITTIKNGYMIDTCIPTGSAVLKYETAVARVDDTGRVLCWLDDIFTGARNEAEAEANHRDAVARWCM